MIWKNWTYWLKGGMICVFTIIVLMGLIKIFAPNINCSGKGFCNDLPYWQYPLVLIFSIVATLREALTGNGFSTRTLIWFSFPNNLIFLFVYFFMGAIIGWIYGKIKHKK